MYKRIIGQRQTLLTVSFNEKVYFYLQEAERRLRERQIPGKIQEKILKNS